MKKIASIFLSLIVSLSCLTPCITLSAQSGDGLLFSFNYSEKCSGVVDKKDTAVLEKVTLDGKSALKITPNPDTAEATLKLDCYSLRYPASDIGNARYMTIEYKYVCPEEYENVGKMYVYLSKGGGALKSNITAYSEENITAGQWTTAVFDVSAIKDNIDLTDGNIFKQFHFFPYGRYTDPTTLSSSQILYIGDVSFYSVNPNPDVLYTVRFKSSNPDADGDDPEALTVKRGDKYVLPENPYTFKNSVFLGWRCSADNTLYMPGTEIAASDVNVIYSAEFDASEAVEEYRVLSFADYHGGSVDKRDNLTVVETELSGRRVVKATPNPQSEHTSKQLTIDGYRYNTSGVDIGKYGYLVVTYYLENAFPKETRLRVNITKNGGALTTAYIRESEEPMVSGRWDFAVFDLTEIDECLNPDLSEHIFKQMHIYPCYGTYCGDLNGDESLYIGELIFFKEKPSLEMHESYMKGYDGGLFKPHGNMTRAEACAIVARICAGGDDAVPTDKTTAFTDVAADQWYFKYISYVESLGYLKSYSGTFEPDKSITRAEFVELIYNMKLLSDNGKNGTFTDVDENHPRAEVISAAGEAGLITGYANGNGTYSFMPDKTITRAEAITVINSALGRSSVRSDISEDVKYFWYDVSKDFWAYGDIAEATLSHIQEKDSWMYTTVPSLSLIDADRSKLDFAAGEAFVLELDGTVAQRVSEIRATTDEITVTGTSYYVSNSGNDSNDGKSPETAWKTLAKVNSARTQMKSGDGIFFERGGIFRGSFSTVSGVTYAAYGEGAKPRLYGSPENGTGEESWTLLDGTSNIWVYKNELIDVGGIIINEGEIFGLKELPDLFDGKFYIRGSGGTKPYDIVTELDENHEFFSEVKSTDLANVKGKLYFRCDEGNPGDLYESIEFNTKGNVIINKNEENVHIDNLCIMYTGTHGIGSASTKNLTVTNCEVGLIGGTIHSYENGKATRLGNGIEIFGSCDGYVIDNCYVYQCYDAGITHQKRFGNEDISMNNITYSNNVIEDCVYNIEYFNGESDDGTAVRDGRNLFIKNNILRRAGYGWGNQRPDKNVSANIKSWDMRNEYDKGTYVIENNIFDRGSWKLLQTAATYNAWCPVYRNNTYVQVIDAGLIEYKKITLDYDCYAEATIKTDIGDIGARVYFLPESYKHVGFLTRN